MAIIIMPFIGQMEEIDVNLLTIASNRDILYIQGDSNQNLLLLISRFSKIAKFDMESK